MNIGIISENILDNEKSVAQNNFLIDQKTDQCLILKVKAFSVDVSIANDRF